MTSHGNTPANLTGIGRAPDCASDMAAAGNEFRPSSDGDSQGIGAVRVAYAREGRESRSTAVPEQMPLLIDKLGERLAFERAGTRLYEALLSKHEAFGSFEGGPSREDIANVLGEELQHFHMLSETISALGGDPTELTPSANVQLTASCGVAQVLADPRTTLVQSLEAIAMAELTDNECWETLVVLARHAGQDQLAERFEEAFETEQEHLDKVRAWLAAGQGRPETEGEGAEVEEADAEPHGDGARGRRHKTDGDGARGQKTGRRR